MITEKYIPTHNLIECVRMVKSGEATKEEVIAEFENDVKRFARFKDGSAEVTIDNLKQIKLGLEELK